MAQTNRTAVALVTIIAVVLIVSILSWGGMMGSLGWIHRGHVVTHARTAG